MDVTTLKKKAADYAVSFVEPGMVVGMGHGSTAIWAVRRIAELLKEGKLSGIVGVACSKEVEAEAGGLGIPLASLDERPAVDLTIDGADEVSPGLDLIKGRGGALLREKMVAQATRREMIIVDESKLSPVLGARMPIPVEVVTFGWSTQVAYLESLGAEVTLRRASDGSTFNTDQGNLILDCAFGPVRDPARLAGQLQGRAGIVEHGLFLGLASDVIVGAEDEVRHLKRSA